MNVRRIRLGPPFRPTENAVNIVLTESEAHRVNTILLRHSVFCVHDETEHDTEANRTLAGQLSNAIEKVLPRPIEGATGNGDADV